MSTKCVRTQTLIHALQHIFRIIRFPHLSTIQIQKEESPCKHELQADSSLSQIGHSPLFSYPSIIFLHTFEHDFKTQHRVGRDF